MMQSKDEFNVHYDQPSSNIGEDVSALLEDYWGVPADIQELIQLYLDQKSRRKRAARKRQKNTSDTHHNWCEHVDLWW